MKKVLYINPVDRGGGATNVARFLSAKAVEYDFESYWLVAEKKSNDDNVDLLPYRSWRKRWSQLRGSDVEGFLSEAIFKHRFYREADLVHFHNLQGYYFDLDVFQKICHEKKVIWTFHDLWPLTASCSHTEKWDLYHGLSLCHGPKLYPRFFLRRQHDIIDKKNQIYNQSDFTIVAPCEWMKACVNQTTLASKKCVVIHNGIDNNIFSIKAKKDLKKKLRLVTDKKIAIFLADGGSSNRWKGWWYYNQIRQKYSDEFFFISIGHHKDDLCYENNFWQLQNLNQYEVADYLASGDVFLLPSVAENFPFVVLEAMSVGLPVISFDVGGVNEVLKHKVNGYIASSKNLTDYCRGIDWFLSLSDKEIVDIQKNNADIVKLAFNKDLMIDSYFQLYNDVLSC